jgi:hypothetical protein
MVRGHPNANLAPFFTRGPSKINDIAWPELAPDELAPAWDAFLGEALETELIATKRIRRDDLTLRKFVETCVAENDHRMQVFDPRLPRPTLLPKMKRLIVRTISSSAAT